MGMHPSILFFFVAAMGAAGAGWFVTEQPVIAGAPAAVAALVLLSARVAKQWERVVILRLGKFHGLRGPGLFFVVPFIDSATMWIDTRTISTTFNAEQTLTEDTVPVDVDAVLFWRVTDAERAALAVEHYYEAVFWAAQTALRDVIGRTTLSTMLSGREELDDLLRTAIHHRTEPWGVTVTAVEIRDVNIPSALQDAMSMSAQADKEREARVILADSERQIAAMFRESSASYEDHPAALHLRAMNILLEGMRANATIIVVPSTAVESMGLGTITGMAALGQDHSRPAPLTAEALGSAVSHS